MAFKSITSNNIFSMHYAIIAAGDGSRLVSEGISQPKPLVRIGGIPMIERLLRIFARNNAESVSVIVNSGMTEVSEFLTRWSSAKKLQSLGIGRFNLVVETTPSSMHSFYCLSKVIEADTVCLTTVDTVFKEDRFAEYIRCAEHLGESDGCFAVTPFIDDEKPLYVETKESRIIGFHDTGDYPYISGGIYCLKTEKAFPVLQHCIDEGVFRMRNFQRALIAAGLNIKAFVFPKIMDVDHADDIVKAEAFLRRKVLFVTRATEFSPNSVQSDRHILELTLARCREKSGNIEFSMVAEEDFPNVDLSDFSVIVGMQRRYVTLTRLAASRKKVLNSAEAVLNTAVSRLKTLMLLRQAGVSVPDFWTYNSAQEPLQRESLLRGLLPGWVKTIGLDGSHKDDVCYVETPLEVETTVSNMALSQISDIIVMRHMQGDLLKVYAVADGSSALQFVHWFYPQEHGYTKFGAETHNDALSHLAFDESKLRDLVVSVSKALRIQFLGIDLIVGKTGEMTVIDVNDWPSYSVCQNEAAEAIARTILKDIEAC